MRLEPRTSRSRVRGVNRLEIHASMVRLASKSKSNKSKRGLAHYLELINYPILEISMEAKGMWECVKKTQVIVT